MQLPTRSLNLALDNAPLSPLHWRVWFLSAMGVFLDGFDLFVIAVALPLIARDFSPDAATLGLIGAAAPLGAVVGAVSLGHLSDRLGRKLVYAVDLGFFVVFAVLSALSWNPASLIAFRFLLGIGIGADYPLSSTYVSEFMPPRLRGRMMVGGFSFQALGALAGATVGLLILLAYPQADAWRWMLAAGVIPAVVVVLMRSMLPESPRWFLSHGKAAEPQEVLAQITGTTVAVRSAGGELVQVQETTMVSEMVPGPAQGAETADTESFFGALFSPRYRRRTILATVPWFLMDICLYGVGFFTPTILAALAFTGSGDFLSRDIASTEGAMLLDLFLLVGFAINLWLIDKWGRIRLQVLGFAGMTVGLVLLAATGLLREGTAPETALTFLGFALFNLMVNAGPNPTTFLLPAELFPTALRASGHGLAASAGKVGAAVGVFLLPVLKDAAGLGVTLALVAVASVLGLLVTWTFGMETKGRSLEQIG